MILPMIILGAPFLPSFKNKDKKILNEIFETLKQERIFSGKFVDLGSGDGRIIIEFAKNNYESYGIEINPFLVLINKIKIKLNKINNAKIIWKNFWNVNLSNFDIIYIYQYDLANKILTKKIQKEAKKNTIIISRGFKLKNLNLLKKTNNFFIYKI
jgi:16S rRNA A1518/A1519 N6-dimethyltransferase RsmA/KsgA/DIM1 with predicted DNA glycosylase/AP lyase activity